MNRMLILAIASLLATSTLAASKPASTGAISERIQIELLEHQWTQAAATGDHPVLNDLLDDKFFEVFPGSET